MERGKPYRDNKEKWRKYRYFVISLLDRFPLIKQLLARIYSDLIILRHKWRSKKIVRKHGNEFDVNKTYEVEPKRIEYCSLEEFNIYKYKGKVIGGNWDQPEKKFEDLDLYIAFKERFLDGKDWKDTLWYQRFLGKITDSRFPGGCKNESDLDSRCESFESLYQSVKNKGYKSQSEILLEENIDNPLRIEDEIAVNVGRHGDLLFNNGAHRLCVVKLLDIQEIPVKIIVRHPQWVSFRQAILWYAKEHRGKIYHPITHPDLCDIPAFHGSDRPSIIKKNLSIRKGWLLDIGAHWGYFCHKFEEIGFDCYAVENNRVNVCFLRKLKRAESKHFKIIPKSIFEYPDIENAHFDVVLALNIFHHFLKKKDSYLKLINLLKNLKMKEMYFQSHLTTELRDEDMYKNYCEEKFVEFILQNSKLNDAKFIGRAKDGRKIYKLY